ncbi:MAG: fibronectin type III domain-containing protein [Planctomycetota bacterium]|nr:fibronectin type III domain-containing protein [Planctomycetota bacterium]
MGKIQSFTMLVLMLSVANAWGAGFMDKFDRPNGDLGNDWETQANGTIEIRIVDNEVLIEGQQATDWTRSGLSRVVENETRISFDFKADNSFNVHIRINDAETGAYIDIYASPGGSFSYAASEDGGWPGWTQIAGSAMIPGEYNNLVLEQEDTEFVLTLNDVVVGTVTNTNLTNIGSMLISCDSAAGTDGTLHIDNVQIGVVFAEKAKNPSPESGAILADTWVNLSWSPGDFTVSHDVYFGDNFDDVDNGTGDTFRGNQTAMFYVAGFPGFAFPDGLIPGTTYYWRIDEVNDTEPNSPWKGDIWSFLIPPKTAYSPDPPDGAEFVDVDARFSWTPGFGAVMHTFYIGTDYAEVDSAAGGVMQGPASYDPGTLELEKVYYWRVDAFEPPNTYKGDIWSFTTPGAVGNSQPANSAVDVQITATLNWMPADNAASSELYFGTDADAVNNATAASPEYMGNKALGSESYDPGKLALDTTYHWRVDAVYPDKTVKGLVWSFETAGFILVDDFESYNDFDPPDPNSNRIFDNWIDGFGTTTNGALVGNDFPPYAEQTIVHGGAQSMPYFYDNNNKTSEATLTLVYPRDWTEGETAKLSLWFRGDSANAADRMFVALNGNAVVYHSDPAATQITGWNEWVVDLTEFAGVDLANVSSITIGFGTKGSPAAGGAGTMHFDDIRLVR